MKNALILFAFTFIIMSCKDDDDNGISEPSVAEQTINDDGAIIDFLKSYYFNEIGVITEFDEEDPSDDNETALFYMAEPVEGSGVFIVKNPNYTPTGPAVTDEEVDDILIQYQLYTFQSENDGNNNYSMKALIPSSSTVNTTGLPIWNPLFYKYEETEESTFDASFYEMSGFKKAIPYFNSSEKEADESYEFSGVIVIPSREAYNRESNYYQFRNDNVVINLELYKVTQLE